MKRFLLVVGALAIALALGAGPPLKSIVLEAIADGYVVTDAATTEDPQGIREQNFSNLDFARAWYRWKVQGQEQLVGISLFKFDLKPLKELQVASAHLQLFASRVDLNQPLRLVDSALVTGEWSEGGLSYSKRPPWTTNPVATAGVYGAGAWYSWDVTPSVVDGVKTGSVSYALGLRALEEGKEEQVVFATREVGRNVPRLIVTYEVASSSGVPWWVWVVGIGGAAVVAFLGGALLTRRRWPGSPVVQAPPAPPAPPAGPSPSPPRQRRGTGGGEGQAPGARPRRRRGAATSPGG